MASQDYFSELHALKEEALVASAYGPREAAKYRPWPTIYFRGALWDSDSGSGEGDPFTMLFDYQALLLRRNLGTLGVHLEVAEYRTEEHEPLTKRFVIDFAGRNLRSFTKQSRDSHQGVSLNSGFRELRAMHKDAALGIDLPTEEEKELVMLEMRRGASGAYSR